MKDLPNILIVDDSEANLLLLEVILENTKVNLIRALSGSEALEKIQGIELALAIIDVRMPEMNGYELALKMNEKKSGMKVPIIFLTAIIFNEKQTFIGYSKGVVDYIFKPIDSAILLCKINVFLELFSQKQTIFREATKLKKIAAELRDTNIVLRKSEEKFRNYIDHAPDGVFIADKTGRYIEVNKAASRITGYSEDELLNMSISDILAEESRKDGLAQFRKVVKTGESTGELLFKHKNGTILWWSVDAIKLSETRFLGFTKDITERKQNEHQLNERAKEMYALYSLVEITQKENITLEEIMQEFTEILPRSWQYPEIACARIVINSNEFVSENFMESRWKLSAPIMIENSMVGRIDICYLEEMPEEIEGPFFIEERILIDSLAKRIGRIAERYKIAQTLEISVTKYKTMLNSSPDGIFIIDMHGIITEVSSIAPELLGARTAEDLMGKSFSQFVPFEEMENLTGIFKKTVNEGLVQAIEMQIIKENGSLIIGEISITLIQDPLKETLLFMFILRDITHRKRIEANQINAARLSSLGEMASGIAHEINQPLNIISMIMDRILFESEKTDTVDIKFLKNKSDKIFDNILRIRNIIDQIKSFSRNYDDYILIPFDINSSIKNASSMITQQFKHLGIKLILQLEKQLPDILGNTHKFEQVVLNLLINAKDAVMEKETNEEEIFTKIIGIKSYQEDHFVIVEITDNGMGIKNTDINNVLLPFYTTKDEGQGTGLGLSICHQIIKDMGGVIHIMSERFNGTIIKLNLPIQQKK